MDPKRRGPRKRALAAEVREARRAPEYPISAAASEAPPTPEPAKKKNLRLHQSKIDAARRVLGTGTETETIETALELVVFRNELIEGVRGMRGARLVNYFGGEA